MVRPEKDRASCRRKFHKLFEDFKFLLAGPILFGAQNPRAATSFVTSQQVDPGARVRLQALVQRYVDQSISSTVNLPADTRLSAIEGLYRKAWESGCKGITVFREGSRASVLERDESEGPHPTGAGSPAGVCTFCEAPTTEDPRAGG